MDTHDANFHMATFYYVLIKATSNVPVFAQITLRQDKKVTFLTNNHDQLFSTTSAYYNSATLFQKVQFDGVNQMAEFHVFQVPGVTNAEAQNYKVQVIIEALTDDFYPMLFLKRQEFTKQPNDLSSLEFPTIRDHDL